MNKKILRRVKTIKDKERFSLMMAFDEKKTLENLAKKHKTSQAGVIIMALELLNNTEK